MAQVLDISDALIARLSSRPFLAGIEVKRAYVPPVRPDQLGDKTQIFVICPIVQSGRGSTREAVNYQPNFWICVMRKVSTIAAQAVIDGDAAVNLMEQIALDLYRAGVGDGKVVACDYDPLFNPELFDAGVFQGVLAVEVKSLLDIT